MDELCFAITLYRNYRFIVWFHFTKFHYAVVLMGRINGLVVHPAVRPYLCLFFVCLFCTASSNLTIESCTI